MFDCIFFNCLFILIKGWIDEISWKRKVIGWLNNGKNRR